MTFQEEVAVGSIVPNLSDRGLVAFWADEKFRDFPNLVAESDTIAAAAD